MEMFEMFIELLNDTLHETGLIFKSIPEGLWQFLVFAAAVAAAAGAFLSARATRIAAQGQLISQLLVRYSSEEMRLSLLKMSCFYLERKKDGDKVSLNHIKGTIKNRVNERGVMAQKEEGVDSSRRQVAHFFRMVLRLYENKQKIDKDFLQHICSFDGFELLYVVVEHFEKEIGKEIGKEYNPDSFTRLLYLSGRDDIQELEKLRPLKEPTVKGPETSKKA